MSIVGELSGENQIAKLTQGIDRFPLNPLKKFHLKAILETIIEAWDNLIVDCDDEVFQEGEECINRLMVSELNNLLDIGPSVWSLLVSSAQDASNIPNYNGRKIGKQPDISLILTMRKSSLPFIIECKLIGPKKGVDLYCTKGILRFVDGDYAWYDQQSIMLAYVQDESNIESKLSPYLKRHQSKSVDRFKTVSLPQKTTLIEGRDLAKSVHNRHFPYIRNEDGLPGAINLWHLWLKPTPKRSTES